jgi:hypothetical protein
MGKTLFPIGAASYFRQRNGVVWPGRFSERALHGIALGSVFLFIFGWAQLKVNAQVTILHSFGDGSVPHDGALPNAALIQAPDGNFYGEPPKIRLSPGAGEEPFFK